MEQKIIFLDIDGTLTEPGHNEPPESAIQAIHQKGDIMYSCVQVGIMICCHHC